MLNFKKVVKRNSDEENPDKEDQRAYEEKVEKFEKACKNFEKEFKEKVNSPNEWKKVFEKNFKDQMKKNKLFSRTSRKLHEMSKKLSKFTEKSFDFKKVAKYKDAFAFDYKSSSGNRIKRSAIDDSDMANYFQKTFPNIISIHASALKSTANSEARKAFESSQPKKPVPEPSARYEKQQAGVGSRKTLVIDQEFKTLLEETIGNKLQLGLLENPLGKIPPKKQAELKKVLKDKREVIAAADNAVSNANEVKESGNENIGTANQDPAASVKSVKKQADGLKKDIANLEGGTKKTEEAKKALEEKTKEKIQQVIVANTNDADKKIDETVKYVQGLMRGAIGAVGILQNCINKTKESNKKVEEAIAKVQNPFENGVFTVRNENDFEKVKDYQDKITKVVIGNESIKNIGEAAFSFCGQLKKVDLGKVTTIGKLAFNGCVVLKEINLENVTSIGENAFSGCASLEEIKLKNVSTISKLAFGGCAALKKVDLGKVTTIGGSAFYTCGALEDINLEKVKEIGQTAFYSCTALKEINLENATTVDDSAFNECTGITTVQLPKNNDLAKTIKDSILAQVLKSKKTEENGAIKFINDQNPSPYRDKVLGFLGGIIGGENFNKFTVRKKADFKEVEKYKGKIEKVVIENENISTIDNSAFSDCAELAEVNLGKVTTIGNDAFGSCTALEKINLENVTKIGETAFTICSSLKEVNLKSATEIGRGAFCGCSLLGKVSLNINVPSQAFQDCKVLKTVTLGEKCETIGEQALFGCTALEKINLENVKTISRAAFKDCVALKEINLKNVTTIGENAFEGCAGINKVTLPKNADIAKKLEETIKSQTGKRDGIKFTKAK